jgi:hypothetical protein
VAIFREVLDEGYITNTSKQMYKCKVLSVKIYDIKNVKIYDGDKIICVSVM